MNVLTVDPSKNCYGWSVFCDGKLTSFGEICPSKRDSDRDVIERIARKLKQIIAAYDITMVVAETPIGSQNASANRWLAAVWAVTITTAVLEGTDWCGIDAATVKKTLGAVHKEQITFRYSAQYQRVAEIGNQKTREAVCDAIAVFHAWQCMANRAANN